MELDRCTIIFTKNGVTDAKKSLNISVKASFIFSYS
ncbi:MAG: hypothetical protein JWR76_1344 [Mucilaginibacter sp.]|nr:hypothetical protein [Mucilaginibacter sp.]